METPPDANRAKPGLAAFAIVGGLTSAIGIAATIARTKVLARVVGPEGVGITAEVSQLVTLAMTAATIASGPALLTRIAEAERDGDPARLRSAVRAGIGLGGALALVAAAVSVGIAPLVLPRASEYPARLFVALAAAAAGIGVLTSVAQTLFVGTANLRAIAMTTLTPTLVSTAAAIALTITFEIRGQFYAIALAAFVAFAASVLYLRMSPEGSRFSLRPTFELAFAKDAFVLGATGLAAGYLGQILFTTIRETLEVVGGEANGARFNGNYQAASMIGNTYFTVVLGSLGTYFMPRYAAAQSTELLALQVREAERFVLKTAPPIVLFAIAFRGDLIHLLYSDRFDVAISILGYQLAGDVARGVSWASAAPLLVRRKVRAFVVLEGSAVVVGAGLNLVLIPRVGPIGTGIAYVATYVVYLAVAGRALRWSCGVEVDRRAVVSTLGFTFLAILLELTTRRFPPLRWVTAPVLVWWMLRSGVLAPIFSRLRRLLEGLRGRQAN